MVHLLYVGYTRERLLQTNLLKEEIDLHKVHGTQSAAASGTVSNQRRLLHI